ncbi:transcription factor MYB44-like protein [Artemisia annua]|uniref:Transcription factor MYB44-like protein n=1 Tax=Artemisia annua TaxID=35608 RepID=A0A2U1MNM5_ARTAN|nr:transcription factor MYB44-like protein [Artemisia annua]
MAMSSTSVIKRQKKDLDQIEGPWSPEEDEMLENLMEKHDRNWSLISMSMPGRSGKSCRLRWLSLYRSFTPEEDEMLQNLVEKHFPNWKKRFASLRLIDPLNGVASQPRIKSTNTLKHKTKDLPQPIKPTSISSNTAISDSCSLINRCNLRILKKHDTTASSDAGSLEVNKIINVGNDLGFDMAGKESDVAHALGIGVNNGFQ